jgi:hypothetical protein
VDAARRAGREAAEKAAKALAVAEVEAQAEAPARAGKVSNSKRIFEEVLKCQDLTGQDQWGTVR